jgi:hypothetical protein
MGFKRCPGSSTFAQPKIELLTCPGCGEDVEVWSDEATGQCTKCGRTATRTSTQSCMDWCKHAQECLGDEKYKQYQEMKSTVRKEALVKATADQYQWRKHQLGLAWESLSRAEQLLSSRPEADPNVVMAAVVLRFAREHAPNTGGTDGLSAAQTILEGLNYPDDFVQQVCGLLELPDPRDENAVNVATVLDALTDANRTA